MASRFTFPPQRDQGIGFTFPPTNKAESSSNNNQISIDIDPSGQDVLEEINEAPLNTFPLHQSVTDAPIIDIPSPTDISEGTSLNNQLLLRQQQQQGTGEGQALPPTFVEEQSDQNKISMLLPEQKQQSMQESAPPDITAKSVAEDYVTTLRQQMATDWKSPSEYALHILFTKFIRYAENKLNMCLQQLDMAEPPIVEILGEGVDPSFDEIIKSLGHIAKKKPKPVIDAMMFWRKTKSEAANSASEEMEKLLKEYEFEKAHPSQAHFLMNRRLSRSSSNTTSKYKHNNNTNNLPGMKRHVSSSFNNKVPLIKASSSNNSATSSPSIANSQLKSLENTIEVAKEEAFLADRKSLISIYILCRVLNEIVKQASSNEEEDLSDKLEEIVFTQLKTTDPLSISTSLIKSSNWNSFAELLGSMSEKKFLSVSDRFIADLEKIPAYIPPELEPSTHLLILGMRYLKLRNYPLEKFEESADFMKSLSKFFAKTENFPVCLAYAEVTNQLLLPLAGSLTAEVNHPTWVEAMSTLLNTAKRLQADNKYWVSGFKLTVSILCASPPDLFSKQWLSLLEANASKVKSKSLNERIIFAVGLSRLVWVYLYRCPETLNNTTRTLTKLLQLYLNTRKKENWITGDFGLLNPLTDALISIGFLHPNFLMEQALIPLIRQSFNGSNLENINYEKLILTINTYKGLLVTKERPRFPEDDNRLYELNLNNITVNQVQEASSINHTEISDYFYKLFLLLDSSIGSEVWSPENQHQKQSSNAFSPFGFSFSNDNDSSKNKSLYVILFGTIIEAIPCCLSISRTIPYKSTIEILSRNAVHSEVIISSSSQNALRALASKKNPYTLITWFAKYSFDFDEKTQSSYNMSYLSSKEYNRLLILYVELLECWLEEFQSSNKEENKKETGLDGIRLLPIDAEQEESNETEKLEWKNTVTVIEEVEGNGLFFLCSHDAKIRRLGIQILRIIFKFDEAMMEKTEKLSNGHSRSSSHFAADRGTRLIDLLNECNTTTLINPHKATLSAVEKTRFSRLNSKYKRGLLIKLAESEYGVDAALWQRAFPKLLALVFKTCPMAMALCRSIVCIRLVQVHEIILRVANDVDFKLKNVLPETIVNQWKLYLIAACTSLTSTFDQKLHIPSNIPQHGRKKSQQIFTVQHQKIKSAKSIFKMVLPLLNAKYIMIRDAIITGLSSMNINIFKAYVEAIDVFLVAWKEGSSNNQIRVEMFHILTILSPYLKSDMIFNDEWILRKLSEFLQKTKQFLEKDSVQISYEYQSLRSYFAGLILSYYMAVREHPLIDELFPFQARASCFNFLKEWCGYGEYEPISEERYAIMIKNTESGRDRTAITTGIEFQKNRLQMIVLETMVVLCSDPITQTLDDDLELPIVISFDTEDLLAWIEALFDSDNTTVKNLGVRALENLLDKNRENFKLFRDVAFQCVSHHSHPSVAVLYYTTLCKSVLKLDNLVLDEDELVSLGLYGLVADKEDTRTFAVDLLSAVETKLHNSSYTKVFKERLANSSKTVYKSTAKEISSIFAELLSQDLCLRIFSSLVRILDLFPFEIKRDLLVLMVPWVNKFTLKSLEELDTFMVLNNLFYITIDLNDSLPNEVEQLWISLGKGNSFQNIHVSLEYIINSSMNHCNPLFVQYARDIVLYLANIPGGIGLLDTLLNNLEPKYMVPLAKHTFNEPMNNNKYSFLGNIWERLNYNGKRIIFSKAQLSIIFLVNLLTNLSESVKAKIPLLLHMSICLLDHYVPLIHESACKIASTLIFGLAPSHEKSEETVKLLRNKHALWSYDNLMKKGARSPKTMDLLIRNIISIFSDLDEFQVTWQRIALKWATTCSVRHIACRSFQIFRSLLTFLDQEMLRDMLHRLSNTISDGNVDIQGFAMQILMTLNAIMAELDPTNLISFPQLFWSITACLSSIHEQEFIEVLSCLSKFISKIDLDSPDTVQCLVAIFPSNWEGRFDGLQQIVMTGLRSANSLEITWKFLDKLNLLKDSRIIANTESRLLFALIANLPRFLNAMDRKDFTGIQVAADSLIELANAYKQPSLSRLIDSLAKNKFRSKKDFMSQVVSFISRNYFPSYSAQTLVFLLGLLFNKIGWIRVQTLEILKYVFPLIDLRRPEFIGVGADLISPLLRLLFTEYEAKALEVLDCVPNVSGSKMDKDVLRITMGNKDVKDGDNATTTLFGLPEDSGWSVPMPTMTAATTRHNVHAVFMTCGTGKSDEVSAHGSDDMDAVIEFHADGDYELGRMDTIVEFHADGDYDLGRMDTNDSISVAEEKDASLSHMWAELDNLDSFFTKDTNVPNISSKMGMGIPHGRSDSIETTRTDQTFSFESAPQLYDKKVSVILNRSLSRTPSNVSFKTHLADSFAVKINRNGKPRI